MRGKIAGLLSIAILLSGCAVSEQQVVHNIDKGGDDDGVHYQRLSDLQFDIEMLTQQGLCAHDGECQTIGIGSKPCGGYRFYYAYSTSTTDITTLMSLAREYNVEDNQLKYRIDSADRCVPNFDPGAFCQAERCVLKIPEKKTFP